MFKLPTKVDTDSTGTKKIGSTWEKWFIGTVFPKGYSVVNGSKLDFISKCTKGDTGTT